MQREERVTVQGPVKEQQPDGMSHRGLLTFPLGAMNFVPSVHAFKCWLADEKWHSCPYGTCPWGILMHNLCLQGLNLCWPIGF